MFTRSSSCRASASVAQRPSSHGISSNWATFSRSASVSRWRQTVSRSASDRGPSPSASSAVTRQVSLISPSGPPNRLMVLAPVMRTAALLSGRGTSTTSAMGQPSSSSNPRALSPSKKPARCSPAKTA